MLVRCLSRTLILEAFTGREIFEWIGLRPLSMVARHRARLPCSTKAARGRLALHFSCSD